MNNRYDSTSIFARNTILDYYKPSFHVMCELERSPLRLLILNPAIGYVGRYIGTYKYQNYMGKFITTTGIAFFTQTEYKKLK